MSELINYHVIIMNHYVDTSYKFLPHFTFYRKKTTDGVKTFFVTVVKCLAVSLTNVRKKRF